MLNVACALSEQQREGEDVGPASFEAPKKSRAPLPQEGKRLAKKRKLAEGVPATNKTRSDEDVWPTMAEGAALLLGALKTAGQPPHAPLLALNN